jgi:hypothetical protein
MFRAGWVGHQLRGRCCAGSDPSPRQRARPLLCDNHAKCNMRAAPGCPALQIPLGRPRLGLDSSLHAGLLKPASLTPAGLYPARHARNKSARRWSKRVGVSGPLAKESSPWVTDLARILEPREQPRSSGKVIDECSAADPRTRGLRDKACGGTRWEGSSRPAHTSRPTEPGEGNRSSPVRPGRNAGRHDRDRAVRGDLDPAELIHSLRDGHDGAWLVPRRTSRRARIEVQPSGKIRAGDSTGTPIFRAAAFLIPVRPHAPEGNSTGTGRVLQICAFTGARRGKNRTQKNRTHRHVLSCLDNSWAALVARQP